MTDSFNPLATSNLVVENYRRYLKSLLPVRDPGIAAPDKEKARSRLAKGPVLEAAPPYEPPIRATASVAETITRTAETFTGQSAYPDLTDAISARHPAGARGGWLALPAMPIAMALLAGLAGRGNHYPALLEREYGGKWGNLTLDAPELVAIDLVLAETLVASLADHPEDSSD
jgi:hypothetical protein